MFDIAWTELLLVAIVAILVVGPKELPSLLRSIGRALGKLRSTADEFRKQFDEAVREAGAEDLQREVNALRKNNPLTQIRDAMDEVARDPFNQRTTKAQSLQQGGDDLDDLAPPPPLPPRGAISPADATPTSSDQVKETQQPAAASKEMAANGAGGEVRLNGEHRPQVN